MILLAVIVGYILGVAPFVVPKIIELIQNRRVKEEKAEEDKETAEIFDEWYNGPKENRQTINQQDIYNEYVTGKETPKGD